MAAPPPPADPPPTDRPTPGGLPDDPAPIGRGAAPPAPPSTASRAGASPPLQDGVAPESRQLPPHQGKLARIGGHVSSLSVDLREWVELRIDLAKAEVRETIEAFKASLKRKGIAIGFLAAAGVLALYGLGFLLGALAWALGDLFDSAALGHLATAVIVFIIVGVLAWIGKRRLDEDQAIEARARVSKVTESTKGTPVPPSTRRLQDVEAEKAKAAAV